MAGKRIKTNLKDVDRSLEDVWRRLDALEARAVGSTTTVNNSTTITGPSTPDSLSVPYSASTVNTTASRQWLSIGSGTIATSLATSSGWPVPAGIKRVTGLVVAVRTAGVGAATVTYRLTVGTVATEGETGLLLTVPGVFTGSSLATANIAVIPGDILRVVVNKSAALGTAQTNVVALVTLEA